VDGKKVDRRSFVVRPGMVVSIKPASRQIKAVQLAQEYTSRDVPEYLLLEDDKSSGKLVSIPQIDQVPHPLLINISLVCESLSHST
jgi:small subunit ribosomal protein S4